MDKTKAKMAAAALGAAALALYLSFRGAFFVGYFNDDALYALGARALLSGRYAALEHPGHPPLNDPLPGYPLFLAPFVKALGAPSPALGLVSVGVALLSVLLLGLGLCGLAPPAACAAAAALYAFNPAVVLYSGALMSDLFYTALVLAAFLLVRGLLRRPSLPRAFGTGLVLAWAALTRPQGIVLAPAVALGLALGERPREALAALLTAGSLWAAWLLRNLSLTQSPAGYLGLWAVRAPLSAYLSHAAGLFTALFADLLLAWPSSAGRAAELAAAALGCALVLRGVLRLARSSDWPKGLLAAILSFCVLSVGVHALWPALADRYFLPLLPFLLLFAVAGLPERRAAWALGALCLALYGFRIAAYASQLGSARPPEARPPEKTFAWVRAHTPPETLFLSADAPLLYLYTQRQALRSLEAPDPEAFRYRLLTRGVSRIWLRAHERLLLAGDPRPGAEARSARWALSWPEAFPVLFRDDAEASAVLGVADDAAFLTAYGRYLDARRAFEASRWEEGFKALERALAADPGLACVRNAYGATLLLRGQDLKRAERELKEAARLRSGYRQPLVNLARLYESQGRGEEARAVRAQSEALP